MPDATLKVVAQRAGVAPVTVSRVINGSDTVAAETRAKILAVIRDLQYTPNLHAANLRRKSLKNEKIAGTDRCINASRSAEERLIFGREERRALARQVSQLRRDLDRLKVQAERIQFCLDVIQDA